MHHRGKNFGRLRSPERHQVPHPELLGGSELKPGGSLGKESGTSTENGTRGTSRK